MVKPRAIVLTGRVIDILSKPPGLTAEPALQLWTLVKQLPVTGQSLNICQLAVDLGLTRVKVANAMQELLISGLVQRGPKVGKVYTYKLNPACFHHL